MSQLSLVSAAVLGAATWTGPGSFKSGEGLGERRTGFGWITSDLLGKVGRRAAILRKEAQWGIVLGPFIRNICPRKEKQERIWLTWFLWIRRNGGLKKEMLRTRGKQRQLGPWFSHGPLPWKPMTASWAPSWADVLWRCLLLLSLKCRFIPPRSSVSLGSLTNDKACQESWTSCVWCKHY